MKCFECFKEIGASGDECVECWQIFCDDHIDADFCNECREKIEDEDNPPAADSAEES